MENEHIESVEHENHEAVERAERERIDEIAEENHRDYIKEKGEDMADEDDAEDRKLREQAGLTPFGFDSEMEQLYLGTDKQWRDYQKLVDNQE